MYDVRIFNSFSKLVAQNILISIRNISSNSSLYLQVTNVLQAEPLKKKKKLDPNVIKAREDRKRRKIEKSIRRLTKFASQLKPICEVEVPRSLKNELELRKRELPILTAEKLEERALLFKKWNKYRTKEHLKTMDIIKRYISNQDEALEQLKLISEQLYLDTIQIDPDLLPYSTKGPCHTPPIENFEAPDGEYKDITKVYEGEEVEEKVEDIKK